MKRLSYIEDARCLKVNRRDKGNGLDPKSGASPRNGAEFCAVMEFLFRGTAGTRLGVVRIKDLHPTKLELVL